MSEIAESAPSGSSLSPLSPSGSLIEESVVQSVLTAESPAAPAPGRRGFRARLRRVGWYLARPLVFLRYLFRKLLWLLVKVIQAGWRHPIVSLMVIIALGLGYQGYNSYIKDSPPPPPSELFDIAQPIPPPPVARNFLEAQKRYDGAAIWDMLAEESKTSYLSQGITKQTYQQQFDDLQTNGIGFGDSTYVGGVVGDNGVNYYFYLTRLVGAYGQQADVYEVFSVDAQTGKLLRVDTPVIS